MLLTCPRCSSLFRGDAGPGQIRVGDALPEHVPHSQFKPRLIAFAPVVVVPEGLLIEVTEKIE